ncbi:hypothetical protein G6F46_007981 [Rhizopus delemar]|uniref:Bromodomain associated domain-containing protein n=3 Tax=Rhizopus TaxID=4842 RepID=I1BWW8_RHIO9|nr:hypothetical protein RO3G_05403 [Rhizopus delemar RA 99-880]KAG1455788.1 hypothetical protein G6F55_006873 [Rhizopus delemar]KAG1540848.1 hypothetical protein G6F51_008273 [Rhizopus arrhizus]KAG1494949.1 hypothetical protein G6F54_007513 [Rhizopus delemar]KAG1515810.1 hypothetical protein G6F53_002636 [Rhizopus delemar]|eukprot:EIE80698.1 hypothetical protein RO3G_05403 [Rhizopus delemar RA 99-880]
MTDAFCSSMLEIVTQRIIQSSGFESATSQSIRTLNDVFREHLELLGSTISAYANLNGRTIGTACDLLDTMEELLITPEGLKEWLAREGKQLSPCWTVQSDPSRLLEGTIRNGRSNFEDAIEYNFQDTPEFDLPLDTPEIEDLPPSPIFSTQLPDYIPAFFPEFPEIKEDTAMEEASNQSTIDGTLKEKTYQPVIPQAKSTPTEPLPPPLIVRNKKKPVDNPFSHIMSFEDSNLATERNTAQQPLSLIMETNNIHIAKEENQSEKERPRKKLALSVIKALSNTNDLTLKLGEGVIGREDIFKLQTEKEAAPGNHLFIKDVSIFEEIVRDTTDPLLLSRLTTPNLLIDVATTGSSSVPATPTTQHMFNDQYSLPSSPQSSTSYNDVPKPNKSSSMLAALASNKAGLKRMGRPLSPMSLSEFANAKASTGSVDINNMQKTGDSKYIIKKKKMLLQQQLLQQQQQLLLQQQQQQQQQQHQEQQQDQDQQPDIQQEGVKQEGQEKRKEIST